MTTRERWAEVERVLDAVLDREPHEWNAAIVDLCGPDAALRSEVESLVARHGAVQRFLGEPVIDEAAVPFFDDQAGFFQQTEVARDA